MQAFKEFIRHAIVLALTAEAKAVLKKYRPKILLITGSVGKTTTKDAVYTALSAHTFVRRSEKSYNSDIGVPLTVLGVPNGWSNPLTWLKNLVEGFLLICLTAPYPEWLVMEVGADRPGDIRALRWLAPDAVVATRFPDVSVHVEFYDSPGAVIEEELAPVWWLSGNGAAILNADDERASAAATKEGVRRLTYGFSKDASVRAVRLHVNATRKMPTGVSFEARYENERAHVSLPDVLGDGHVSAALGGIAAAIAVGVPFADAAAAFAAYVPPSGRMRLIPGMRGSVIIDDSYNASPAASEKALASLAGVPRTGKRIAILADMLELGTFSVDEHRRIGALVPDSADILITCGIRAREIARAALDAGMPQEQVFECDTGADAAARLISLIAEGDVVLVKGSQSMRMERVVKSVMLQPEKAKELLVRQEGEWLARS